MVTSKGELSQLLLDHEIAEVLLVWELITESETVIVETETESHLSVSRSLDEVHNKLVVVVADLSFLTPYRLPSLVESRSLCAFHCESVVE